MIHGTDTAKFQPDGTYDPGAFEIVNVEDPQFEQKTARNLREARPSGAYAWIYSNDHVPEFTSWAIDRARAAGANFGVWADYEEEGPEGQWRLEKFFGVCDEKGERAGYYANNWRVDHRLFAGRPFWLAGYPDPNDGVWRDGYTPRASRDVQVWQWSSGGGLDRNVIIDEAWFARWVHGNEPTEPEQQYPADRSEGTMQIVVFRNFGGGHSARLCDGLVKIDELHGDGTPEGEPFGIPIGVKSQFPSGVPVHVIPDSQTDQLGRWLRLSDLATAHAENPGGGDVPPPVPGGGLSDEAKTKLVGAADALHAAAETIRSIVDS